MFITNVFDQFLHSILAALGRYIMGCNEATRNMDWGEQDESATVDVQSDT